MEGYVWELTHELSELGYSIEIICEEAVGPSSNKIKIHLVDKAPTKPRWKSMLLFRQSVTRLIKKKLEGKTVIIHSHERSLQHHVTTFHGPPMDTGLFESKIPILNRRIKNWEMMERQELLYEGVNVVVPVSKTVARELLIKYPTLREKKIIVGYPGTHVKQKLPSQVDQAEATPLHFVFVGKEWKRKGLAKALEVIEKFNQIEECILHVYGPSEADIPKQIRNNKYLKLNGWSQDIPWHLFKALILPTKKEPFGMVISEARAAGVPVLTSEVAGCIELDFFGLIALPSSAPTSLWVRSLNDLISSPAYNKPEIKWTWSNLAALHINQIYPSVAVSFQNKCHKRKK